MQTGSLNAFGEIFNYAFNMQGVVPNNEAIVSLALNDFATDTAYIMCLGMIANIVLARFSRWHYIFLTGHHTLYMACMLGRYPKCRWSGRYLSLDRRRIVVRIHHGIIACLLSADDAQDRAYG